MNRLMIIFMVVLMFVAPVASALEKPDLVFLDFCANDGAWSVDPATLATYEHLLRRLVGANVCVVHAFFGGKDMFGAKYDPERTFARRTYAKLGFGQLFVYRSSIDRDWKTNPHDTERTIEIVPVVDPKNPKGTLRLGAVFSAVLKMIASPEDGKATDVSKTVEQVDHSRAN